MATREELEKRVQILEDIEAIRKLKGQYAKLCDDKYSCGMVKETADLERIAREIANLFTEDGFWDGGEEFGVCKGRQEIYERFNRASFNFAVHYFIMPTITVEGDRATGHWYLLQAATLRDNTPVWMSGFEDDEYVRVDGRWLCSAMKLTILFFTPYEQGWAKKRMIR